MSSRVWGLDRRQTIAVFAVVVVLSVLIGLFLGPFGDGGSGHDGRIISPGTAASPRAVWVFGFETLRFDPSLRLEGRLRARGFGDVQSAAGQVDFFDAARGAVGRLDSATNRLRRVATVLPGTAQGDLFAPAGAQRGGYLWLVNGPGTLIRMRRATNVSTARFSVAPDVPGPVATGVVAGPDAVYAATAGPGGLTVARVDPAGATVVGSVVVPVPGAFTLDGLAFGAGRLWILAAGTAYALDPATLRTRQQVRVRESVAGDARGLAAAGGAVFALAGNGSTLVRVDGAAPRVALRLLATAPRAFRIPAALVARGSRVYALVQRSAGGRATRLVGYDAVSGRATRAVDLPSSLFAGAIAAT